MAAIELSHIKILCYLVHISWHVDLNGLVEGWVCHGNRVQDGSNFDAIGRTVSSHVLHIVSQIITDIDLGNVQLFDIGLKVAERATWVILGEEVSMILLVKPSRQRQIRTLQPEAYVIKQGSKSVCGLDIKSVAILDVYLFISELLYECDKVIEVLICRVKIDVELVCGVVQLEMILEWNR